MANEKINEKKVVTNSIPTTEECSRATDKSDFEYVSIPERDSRGFVYPDIRLNRLVFEAGKKHFVHPVLAAQMRDRMKAFDKSVLRSLLSSQDNAALQRVPGGSTNL